MRLADIQNGLGFAGNRRNRNYTERACAPDCRKAQPTYNELNRAFKKACQIITLQDEFIKTNCLKKDK